MNGWLQAALDFGGPVAGFLVARTFFPRVVKVTKAVRSVAIPMTSPPDDGPYRTADFPELPAQLDPIVDMARAIEDATAAANAKLREGKLSAYDYGIQISTLETAARRAADLQRQMRKVER